jgi:hypothetical protein
MLTTPQAWQPIITPRTLYCVFFALFVPFIALGVAIKVSSDAVVEYSVLYDDGRKIDDGTYAYPVVGSTGLSVTDAKVFTIDFTVGTEMKAPVFVYYQLTNFYQNHRRYVQSKSDLQLAGTQVYTDSGASALSTCTPAITSSNGKVLHPCGLIANSFFNGEGLLRPVSWRAK